MTHPIPRGFAVLPAIFIVIALVAAVGVGYVLIKQPFAEELATNETATSPTANTNTTTDSLTADWKTYTVSKSGGFTFKYPHEWESPGSGAVQEKGYRHLVQGAQFWFVVDPEELSGLEYLTKNLGTENITVADVQTRVIKNSDTDGTDVVYSLDFTRSNHRYIFRFFFRAVTPQDQTHYAQVLRDILSTVIFSPSDSTSTATADWKTYSNTNFHFTLKYPGDWAVTTGESNNATAIFLKSADAQETISFFPEGEFDAGVPPFKKIEILTLGGKAAQRRYYSATTAGTPTHCYYEFPTAPADNWVAPNSEGKNGNRIQTACSESATVVQILSTFTFTK